MKLGWGTIKIKAEKPDTDEKDERKASKQVEDHFKAVIDKRALIERFKNGVDPFEWGEGDSGAIIFLKNVLLKGAYGLRRLGYSPQQIEDIAWGVQQWEDARRDGETYLEAVLDSWARKMAVQILSISILPEDVGRDIVGYPYLQKPGTDREAQRLIP